MTATFDARIKNEKKIEFDDIAKQLSNDFDFNKRFRTIDKLASIDMTGETDIFISGSYSSFFNRDLSNMQLTVKKDILQRFDKIVAETMKIVGVDVALNLEEGMQFSSKESFEPSHLLGVYCKNIEDVVSIIKRSIGNNFTDNDILSMIDDSKTIVNEFKGIKCIHFLEINKKTNKIVNRFNEVLNGSKE